MHTNNMCGIGVYQYKIILCIGCLWVLGVQKKRLSINSKEFLVLYILFLPTYVKIRLSRQGIVACHILMSEFCKMIETTKYGSK